MVKKLLLSEPRYTKGHIDDVNISGSQPNLFFLSNLLMENEKDVTITMRYWDESEDTYHLFGWDSSNMIVYFYGYFEEDKKKIPASKMVFNYDKHYLDSELMKKNRRLDLLLDSINSTYVLAQSQAELIHGFNNELDLEVFECLSRNDENIEIPF